MLRSGQPKVPELLELFLQLGMSPNTLQPEPPGSTPLISALSSRRRPKVIARLLEAGANPALTDARGHSAVAHLVDGFHSEIPGRDTFEELFRMLTAHPDVTPEDRALWSPGVTRWASYLRLMLRPDVHLPARRGPRGAPRVRARERVSRPVLQGHPGRPRLSMITGGPPRPARGTRGPGRTRAPPPPGPGAPRAGAAASSGWTCSTRPARPT